MRHMYHNFLAALFVMHALVIFTSCDQSPRKKIARRFWAQNDRALEIQNLMSAKTLEITQTNDALPLCLNHSYPAPVMYTGELDHWRGEAAQIKTQILAQIHAVGLTSDFAVQLALINNPTLMAYYENLEVAHADLLEAGLRQNPGFKRRIRYPDDPTQNTEEEIETSVDFLDYFLIPFRENAAFADLKVIESEFGQMVLDLAKEVKINWLLVKTLTMELMQELQRVELKKLAYELAELQRQAGNVGKTTVRAFKIDYELARSDQLSLVTDLEEAREKLNRSLGLFGPEICFPITGEIDGHDDEVLPPLFDLEQAAIDNRLDIEAIRREIFALAEEAKLKDPWTYTHLAVGHSLKTESDGSSLLGPRVELKVPIFNSGQAARQKSHALIEKAQKELVAKAIEACSEVREFLNTMNIYRSQLKHLEQVILPDFTEQIDGNMIKHNVMTYSIFDLFALKNQEIDAIIDYIQTLRHYLTAQIELRNATGGDFAILGGVK